MTKEYILIKKLRNGIIHISFSPETHSAVPPLLFLKLINILKFYQHHFPELPGGPIISKGCFLYSKNLPLFWCHLCDIFDFWKQNSGVYPLLSPYLMDEIKNFFNILCRESCRTNVLLDMYALYVSDKNFHPNECDFKKLILTYI